MKKVWITALTLIDCLLAIGIWHNRPGTVKQAKADYAATHQQVVRVQRDTKNVTIERVSHQVKRQKVDLNNVKKQLTQKINSAMNIAYGQTHNKKDYAQTQSKLPGLVGDDFAQLICKQVKGSITQAGYNYPSQKLDNCHIAFGKYNMDSNTLPVMIAVQNDNNQALVTQQGLGKTSFGLYTATYNTRTHRFTHVSYTKMRDPQFVTKGAQANE